MCPDDRIAEFDGWDTDYVRETCKFDRPNTTTEILGAFVGNSADDVVEAAIERCGRIREKRDAINSLGHAPTELVLTRRCGDVANFGYWLRCYGDTVSNTPAQLFDENLRASVEATLGGCIPDTSWWQSNVSVAKAGLGMRTAPSSVPPSSPSSTMWNKLAWGRPLS